MEGNDWVFHFFCLRYFFAIEVGACGFNSTPVPFCLKSLGFPLRSVKSLYWINWVMLLSRYHTMFGSLEMIESGSPRPLGWLEDSLSSSWYSIADSSPCTTGNLFYSEFSMQNHQALYHLNNRSQFYLLLDLSPKHRMNFYSNNPGWIW